MNCIDRANALLAKNNLTDEEIEWLLAAAREDYPEEGTEREWNIFASLVRGQLKTGRILPFYGMVQMLAREQDGVELSEDEVNDVRKEVKALCEGTNIDIWQE